MSEEVLVKSGRGRPAGQKNGGLNKSQEIRNFFSSTPDAKIRDCIEGLGKKGILVTSALVTAVKNRIDGKPGNKRRSKEVTVSEAMMVKTFIDKSGLDHEVAGNILNEFTELVIKCGGVARFKQILEQYEGLTCAGHSVAAIDTEDMTEVVSEELSDDSDESSGEDEIESDYEDVNDEEDDE